MLKVIIFAGFTLFLGSYLIVSKSQKSRIPKVPLGLLVLFFLLKTFASIFKYADLEPTAVSIDVAAAIVLWMAIIRIVVYFVVDFFIRQKKKIAIPTITRDFGLAIVYIIIAMIVLKHRTDINLGSLLTTSAILTAVIGFAMQDTLGNLFSGLALQLEHPYQIDDWVGFEGIEGKVVGITWKSTKILTRTEELIFVPNNTIAKSRLINFSRPSPKHITYFEIGTSYNDPPHKVREAITDVVMNHPMVDRNHTPLVMVAKYDNFSISYKVFFATEDFATEGKTKAEILNDLWYKFKREGIKIPYPIQEEWQVDPLLIEKKENERLQMEIDEIPSVLEKIDIFSDLTQDIRKELAGKMDVLQFAIHENIVTQGDPPGPMYIIKEGECSILVSHGDNLPVEVATLEPMQFFGEMGVLTGSPRTATVKAKTHVVCYEIEKEDIREIFEKHPSVMSSVSLILVRRQAALEKHKAKTEDAMKIATEQQNQLISKIKSFLGL